MAIKVHCEGCGTTLEVKDEFAGKKGRCPTCKTILDVPAHEPTVPTPIRATPGRPPTQRQLDYAANLGISVPKDADRAQVSELIEKAQEALDTEKWDRIRQLEDKESEHYAKMRLEIENEISEDDPRVSSATPSQIIKGFEDREIAAILITMPSAQIDDALTGDKPCTSNLTYTDSCMNNDDMQGILTEIALKVCKQLQRMRETCENAVNLAEEMSIELDRLRKRQK